jgi:hypothetical protein
MKKLALVLASLAGIGFAAPGYAMENSATQERIQLAQAGVSVSIGERPAIRHRTIIRHDRGNHYGWRNNRGHRHGWRNHYGRGDNVVIVKKRKPAKRTVIIER